MEVRRRRSGRTPKIPAEPGSSGHSAQQLRREMSRVKDWATLAPSSEAFRAAENAAAPLPRTARSKVSTAPQLLSRRALMATITVDRAMSAAPSAGESTTPTGYIAPAAMGMAKEL